MVRVEILGEIAMVDRTHPVCAIDENAISFRICVWFSPPSPPIVMDMIAMVNRAVWLILFDNARRIDNGASFCHVSIVRLVSVVVPCVTSGSQKWNGAAAIFIIRASVISVVDVWFVVSVISHWEVSIAFIVAANIMVIDANVWVRKYFVAASVDRGWLGFEIIGIMDNVLISRQAQAIIQCVDAITRMVLSVMLVGIINHDIRFISEGRSGIFGVWAR